MEKTLKVLMISSDRKLFQEGSAVSERIKEYGKLVEELHIVVLALNSLGLKEKQLTDNVWLYPTNSFSKWLYVWDASKHGQKLVKEKSFVRGRSLVTAQDPFECGWAAMKVSKKWRLPLEVQLHTDPFSPFFSGVLNSARKKMAKKVLHQASGVRVVSADLKAKIAGLTPGDVEVLPIYVDKRRIEESPITFDLRARFNWRFILLSVARLSPEKNLGLAIRALAIVRQRFPSAGLVVVGSGPEERKLKSLAKKLGLNSAVAFVGWQEDLASYYKTANAFIQTSFFEGYGLSLVEAGLSGLPVITTPVGIAKELEHGNDAYIYPLDSAQGKPEELFAEGIIDLIENNYRRENMRINLRRTLESKLLSKEAYLERMKEAWKAEAARVK